MEAASVVMADDMAEPETIVEAAADSKLASAVLRIELTALVPIALSLVATTEEAFPAAGEDEAMTDPETEAGAVAVAAEAEAVAGACTCPSSIWLTTDLLARTVALRRLECFPPTV
jgi:hypothetical protein